MPSDFAFKVMNAAHHGIIKLTGGRAGWSALGMPVLKLTTTGRTTDRPRVVMLTSPVQDGEALVVVASRGGDDKARDRLGPDFILRQHADGIGAGAEERGVTERDDAGVAEREIERDRK